jgi:folate-binding protein YgfZ
MADFLAEYNATLAGAGLFDRSDAAKLHLTGPDTAMFLGNLCTNDIKNLLPGTGCPAFFCDPRAKVKFQAWVWHLDPSFMELHRQESSFWVETTPGSGKELFQYLDRYLISERVEIADRTAEFAQFYLAGPSAAEMVRTATGLKSFDPAEYSMVGAWRRRRDLLGVPGFDLVMPKPAPEVRDPLLAAGAVPASREVFETLRIEAGTPHFGPDIDENRFVMEVAGAARAVSYTKGCYLGQEPIVMARDRAGHVNRAFLGMKVQEGGPLPAGAKVFHDGQEVGVVTSSCHSPRLGAPVALGYLRWKHQEVGTRMEAETPAGRQPVEVLGMPPVK